MNIRLEHACKRYGEKDVLNDFNHSFPSHGVVWISGASGCGKTTLLTCIAGAEKLDSGSISIPDSRKIVCLFQEDRLLPWETVLGNVAIPLSGHRREVEDKAAFWLERVGLGGELSSYPSRLSGGMKRRVAIARMLAYGGDIYLLDEPFAPLDRRLRDSIWELFMEQCGNALVIVVSHGASDLAMGQTHVTMLTATGLPLRIQEIPEIPHP
ncbi:ATP-binding cassette domain-containing protein [Parasphaerochaeta coccoides]|uniref:Fe(3+)-transporting ATPase n=1 Tax=Parasphaerochaeta coccoides (strain ATCC BAA-1237 / DSM 17374 / SPN1) TaxID=760011 RepID=F4GHP5_PARC1|nr:ATP-binding cassette domain-containing protein [Parasphaerochaeta coccoides]AEC01583.1 Fe(3+)-transporting ATPase [Parasphaerochaeta coccoides DSM 17374]